MTRYILPSCLAMVQWAACSWAAPPTEAQALAETQRIKNGWDQMLQQNAMFLARCGDLPHERIGIAYERIGISGSVVSYDVKKTDSVLHPYQGVVVIHGYIQGNDSSPRANGLKIGSKMYCFKTVEEAIENNDIRRGNPYDADYILYYADRDGGSFVLSSYNKFFYNALYHDLEPMLYHPYNKQILSLIIGNTN